RPVRSSESTFGNGLRANTIGSADGFNPDDQSSPSTSTFFPAGYPCPYSHVSMSRISKPAASTPDAILWYVRVAANEMRYPPGRSARRANDDHSRDHDSKSS